MELQSFDFESSLKSIETFVKGVVCGQDENRKIRLKKKLKHFLQITNNPSNTTRKRPSNLNFEVSPKRIKPDCEEKFKIPNEIWTKIMNYLPTKEIFQNFGLVSKQFHGLIGGIKYLQVRNIDENTKLCKKILEVMNNCKSLVELDLDIPHTPYVVNKSKARKMSQFVYQAINICQRLKSLKISGICYINRDFIGILKQFGNHFEHLAFEGIQTNPQVLIEISKLKSLKSLKLCNLNIYSNSFAVNEQISEFNILDPQVIEALRTSSNQFESIDFQYSSINPEVSKALNKFFSKKKDTLKKVGLRNSITPFCHGPDKKCETFVNINSCKNLQEFSGNLHFHDFQHTQLKKLKYIDTTADILTFGLINRKNLEHLEIKILQPFMVNFFRLKFPALQHLMIDLIHNSPFDKLMTLNKEHLKKLIKTSPNLKTLKFQGHCDCDCIPAKKREMLALKEVFEEFGTVSVKVCKNASGAQTFAPVPVEMTISLNNTRL